MRNESEIDNRIDVLTADQMWTGIPRRIHRSVSRNASVFTEKKYRRSRRCAGRTGIHSQDMRDGVERTDRYVREPIPDAPQRGRELAAPPGLSPYSNSAASYSFNPAFRNTQTRPNERGTTHEPSIITWNSGLLTKTSSRPGNPNSGIHGVQLFLGRSTPVWKRTMDILGASAGLILLSPVFLVTAALIKTVSPGPVFFSQKRVGFRGKLFDIWKFRTMRADADASLHRSHIQSFIKKNPNTAMEKLDNDPRIIPLGRFFRKTAIDELPQLFNVLRGDMSLIGPRPDLPYAVQSYEPWATRRFDVIPGMTGLWQVSGKNRTTYLEMMRLDIRYVQQRTFLLDLKILLKTVPVIIGQVIRKSTKN